MMPDRPAIEAELLARGYRLVEVPDAHTPFCVVLDWERVGCRLAFNSARWCHSLGEIANHLRTPIRRAA